jgi:hypothetical protein
MFKGRHASHHWGRFVGLTAVVVLGLTTGACGGQEQWGPFRGRLVNSETGEPIVGGLVFVYWQRNGLSGPGLGIPEFIAGQEAVTDGDGWFHAPGIPRVWRTAIDPPGFGFYVPWFREVAEEVTPPDGRPYVDPTVVKMRPLKTFQERCSNLPMPSTWIPENAYPKVMASYQAALKQCEAESREVVR